MEVGWSITCGAFKNVIIATFANVFNYCNIGEQLRKFSWIDKYRGKNSAI